MRTKTVMHFDPKTNNVETTPTKKLQHDLAQAVDPIMVPIAPRIVELGENSASYVVRRTTTQPYVAATKARHNSNNKQLMVESTRYRSLTATTSNNSWQ